MQNRIKTVIKACVVQFPVENFIYPVLHLEYYLIKQQSVVITVLSKQELVLQKPKYSFPDDWLTYLEYTKVLF
jgi:hypothetical protein